MNKYYLQVSSPPEARRPFPMTCVAFVSSHTIRGRGSEHSTHYAIEYIIACRPRFESHLSLYR